MKKKQDVSVLQTNGSGVLSFASSGGKFESALLHVRDEKASGTAGGSATSGSYQTRTLNTSVTNEISGASLSSNQITLPTGTYFVNGFVSSFYVDKHKSKLRNTTDSTDTLIGQVVRSDSTFYSGGASIIIGRFTIASTKVFEIQTRVQTTRNTDGYGEAPSFGDAEVYIDVQIWKVA